MLRVGAQAFFLTDELYNQKTFGDHKNKDCGSKLYMLPDFFLPFWYGIMGISARMVLWPCKRVSLFLGDAFLYVGIRTKKYVCREIKQIWHILEMKDIQLFIVLFFPL